ncbi:hypothetical protein BY458DRAFT_583100 [Sporodiniella umbellata]|nr:hypothetical protein BY458DRAFT_583100 [Sporodiniella umbellata]
MQPLTLYSFSHFCLFFGTVALVIVELWVIAEDLDRYGGCMVNSLRLDGFVQTDQIYHGLAIVGAIYQYFLFIESQRDSFYLLACLLYSLLYMAFKVVLTLQHFLFEQAGCFDRLSPPALPLSHPWLYSSLGLAVGLFGVILVTCVRLRRRNRDLPRTMLGWGLWCGLVKVDGFMLWLYSIQLFPASWLGYPSLWAWEGLAILTLSTLIYLATLQAVRKEQGWVLLFFIAFQSLRLGYLAYRTFVFVVPAKPDPYELTRYSLLFSTLTLSVLGSISLGLSIECAKNTMYHRIKLTSVVHCSHCQEKSIQ